mmetsp:Transcript_5766/g.8846  ORF Transcript_5766/g.8846 Transcript_5766/m.8846 type:complete len:169 (-) Transcript_5766:450-956(-)
MAAIKNDPRAIEFVSTKLKDDKEIAVCAIAQHPDSIKHVSERIKRNREVLIASGMFDVNHEESCKRMMKIDTTAKKIVLSTRFSLDKVKSFRSHQFLQVYSKKKEDICTLKNGNFKVYSPNAFDQKKKTCDPKLDRFFFFFIIPCREEQRILARTTTMSSLQEFTSNG